MLANDDDDLRQRLEQYRADRRDAAASSVLPPPA
jgi:hypothetical protein